MTLIFAMRGVLCKHNHFVIIRMMRLE